MKENLQDKLVEILSAIQVAAGKASDFTLSQLPDIVQSYIMYGRAYYTIGFLVWLSVVLSGIWLIRSGVISGKGDPDSDDAWVCIIFGILALSVGITGMSIVLSSTLMVWFAPKVWLLKEIASMVK